MIARRVAPRSGSDEHDRLRISFRTMKSPVEVRSKSFGALPSCRQATKGPQIIPKPRITAPQLNAGCRIEKLESQSIDNGPLLKCNTEYFEKKAIEKGGARLHRPVGDQVGFGARRSLITHPQHHESLIIGAHGRLSTYHQSGWEPPKRLLEPAGLRREPPSSPPTLPPSASMTWIS